jgi:hypothetical protein
MLTRLIALLVLTGALSVRGQDALTPATFRLPAVQAEVTD